MPTGPQFPLVPGRHQCPAGMFRALSPQRRGASFTCNISSLATTCSAPTVCRQRLLCISDPGKLRVLVASLTSGWGPWVLAWGCGRGLALASVSPWPRPWQVMLVIDAAVTNVEDLSSLEEYLAGLGRKHRAVGVKLSSFSVGKGNLPLSGAPDLRPPLSPSPPLSTCSLSPFPHSQMPRLGACICFLPAV